MVRGADARKNHWHGSESTRVGRLYFYESSAFFRGLRAGKVRGVRWSFDRSREPGDLPFHAIGSRARSTEVVLALIFKVDPIAGGAG